VYTAAWQGEYARIALLRAGRMALLRALLAHHFYVHLYLCSARQTSL